MTWIKDTHLYKRFRANKKLAKRKPFPSIIMIQTASMCNADCPCCPYPYLNEGKKLLHGFMSDDLFDKIVEELRHHSPARVSPYWNNEPMIDPKFLERAKKLREVLPQSTKLHISTNASRLDEKSWDVMANCFDKLHISAQGGITNKENFEKNMPGIQYDIFVKNVEGFLNFITNNNHRLKADQITINNVIEYENQNLFDREMECWKPYGVNVNIGGFNSYSGTVKIQQSKSDVGNRVYGCKDKDRPIQAMHILANGDSVLCCNDWVREIVLGNVNQSSLEEIWNSKKYLTQAKTIYSGKEIRSHMCSKCDLALVG